MTVQATLEQLIDVLNAAPLNVAAHLRLQTVLRLNTDSRAIQRGEFFLALQGESFDGHQFVTQAIAPHQESATGAIAAIVDRP